MHVFRSLWIVCLLAISAIPSYAVKIALAPPPYLEGKIDDALLFRNAATLWFAESLARAPGVERVPEPRNSALIHEISSGAWIFSEPNLQVRYARYEPVDAVLSFSSSETEAKIVLDLPTGRRVFTPSTLAPAGLMKELKAAAAFISDTLKLGPEAAAALADLPKLDGDSFMALCQARRTFAAWPRNSGEARLILLQPAWKKYSADPRVCAEVLSAAACQFASHTRDGAYNGTALNMARMTLPAVLATPYEAAALEMARALPKEMIPELTRVAGGLTREASGGKVGAALDDLLDATDEPAVAPSPTPGAGGAWASGVFTRPQMLGAVRVLAGLSDKAALDALAKLEKSQEADVQKALAEARAPAAASGGSGLPADLPKERLMQLANDPDDATAAEARRRLAGLRPAGEAEAAAFDLATASGGRRLAIIAQAAAAKAPWGEALLAEAAASNPDSYARAAALAALAERAPAKARPLALQALTGDGHKWLRLQASAWLAAHAEAADAAALKPLAASAPEPAVRGNLAVALAKAEGKALPAKPAARPVAGSRNLSWVCGPGEYAPESPFDAYYCLSLPADLAHWKKIYDKGKIFFVRISTVGHPGLIVVNRQQRDRFWLQIEQALPAEALPMIDGLVFGEETMKMDPDGLWKDGWRLFCDELKLDQERVAGEVTNLTPPEAQAFQTWAWDRGVDGFNMIYDYVKARYAIERPGLQVCTFLPGEPGTPGSRRWKFDVGGIYDYKCDSRMSAYSLVRRIRTLWPERPVIWLSLGIGGYEMNPVKRGQQVPAQPMSTRRIRCYADAVAAWLAGADTGWFSVWIFVDPRFSGTVMSGVQVGVEDIGPGSSILKRAVDYSFKGAEDELTAVKAPKKIEVDAAWDTANKPDEQELEGLTDLVQGRDKAAEAKASVDVRKKDFARGFLFYQQYVYDCARVFKSLPRLPPRHFPALAVFPGANVWTLPATANPVVPGHALLNEYDFLSDLKDAAQLDLSAYRLILVRNPGPQTAAVAAALTDWLRKTEGVLYIQGGFNAGAEWGGPGNLTGRLTTPFPWFEDVRMKDEPEAGRSLKPLALTGPAGAVGVNAAQATCTWTLSGDRARAVLTGPNGPVLAVWRDPAFKGAVVFDGLENASRDYILLLRGVLGEAGGPAVKALLAGPVLQETGTADGVAVAVAGGYYRDAADKQAVPGIDLLTGEADPVVGGGMSAALAATQFAAGHAAVLNGVSLLAEFPPEKVEAVEGGLRFRGGGLVRLAGEGLTVTADGAPLPAVTNVPLWLVESAAEGRGDVAVATNRTVVYVRASNEVTVKRGKP